MTGADAASPGRVLLTKHFLDSHDRAVKTIATSLRDAGMEVILVDYETAEDVAAAVVDEDVDVVGISFMSGGQVAVTQRIMDLLRSSGASDVPVVVGGTIRPFDLEPIERAGVRAVFRGGEPLASIASTFARLAADRRAATSDVV